MQLCLILSCDVYSIGHHNVQNWSLGLENWSGDEMPGNQIPGPWDFADIAS
jgi:hypothetical protein